MTLPRIILHNSVSLDGSLTGFQPDMESHYMIAGGYRPDANLVGSNTARTGFDLFGAPPPEKQEDMTRPEKDENLPYWVIPDTKGQLKGFLHGLRSFEFCRDAVILLSETSPRDYVEYLKERDYRHHVIGRDKVDIEGALELLHDDYGVKTVVTDAGRILGSILLERGLISEISLLIHPVFVGPGGYGIFGNIGELKELELLGSDVLERGTVHVRYSCPRIVR